LSGFCGVMAWSSVGTHPGRRDGEVDIAFAFDPAPAFDPGAIYHGGDGVVAGGTGRGGGEL
ncbi:hypothetical protein AB0M44_50090, partial [Streptosporangium subroseum]|uniref:hypothetical protein n=1 Tax=Streptosporangium subroseum TaxID=106412 RepID=UPI00342E0831